MTTLDIFRKLVNDASAANNVVVAELTKEAVLDLEADDEYENEIIADLRRKLISYLADTADSGIVTKTKPSGYEGLVSEYAIEVGVSEDEIKADWQYDTLEFEFSYDNIEGWIEWVGAVVPARTAIAKADDDELARVAQKLGVDNSGLLEYQSGEEWDDVPNRSEDIVEAFEAVRAEAETAD